MSSETSLLGTSLFQPGCCHGRILAMMPVDTDTVDGRNPAPPGMYM